MFVGGSRGGVPMTAPARRPGCGIAPGFDQAVTVVTASTTAMTASERPVVISGTRGSSP